MKCPKCNNELKDGMKFCPKCGIAIPQVKTCPNCGSEIKEGLKFCSKCGTKIDSANMNVHENLQVLSREATSNIICPICSASLKIEDRSCPNCHRTLVYNCCDCKNIFTYGEVIKNNGCCPHCGGIISTLGNIPNDKYPFYKPQQSQPQQSISYEEENNHISLISKIFAVGFLVLSLLGGIGLLLGYGENSGFYFWPLINGIIGCVFLYKWIKDLSCIGYKIAIAILFVAFCGGVDRQFLNGSISSVFGENSNGEDEYFESGKQAVLAKLKAPSTAIFLSYANAKKMQPIYEDYLKIKFQDYQAVTAFEVEAENEFGGRVRNWFYVYYVDKRPIDVAEEEYAIHPNRDYVLSSLNSCGFFK